MPYSPMYSRQRADFIAATRTDVQPMVDAAAASATQAAALAAQAATSVPGHYWQSVRFPPENGENKYAENGGLQIPNTSDLLRRSTAGDAPLFASAGAIAVLWRVPRFIYDGLRRAPVILGNERMASSTANRQLRIGYVTGMDNGNSANAGKFRAILRGESGNGTLDIYSAAPTSAFTHDALIVTRFDGTNFVIDVWDCRTGTKLAGTPVAKPSGWAGISAITGDLGIGIISPASFPQDNTNLSGQQNIAYARGECGGVLCLDSYGTDAEWLSFAQGGNPLTLWPSSVRMWAPLAENGALSLKTYRNLASPVAYAADLVQKGTLLPGSSARNQSAATYLRAERLPDPALVNIRKGASDGQIRLDLTMAGQTAGDEIQCRVVNRAGVVIRDWMRCGAAVASGTVTVAIGLPPGLHRLHFRTQTTGTMETINTDISVGLGILVNGQSQAVYTLTQGLSELGDNTALNTQWSGNHGHRCFLVATMTVSPLTKQAIYRAATKPGIIGDGAVAFFNRMARTIEMPIHLIVTAVSGTSIQDTLSNSGSPNTRNISDIYAITSLMRSRDIDDKQILTLWTQFWHSSGSVQAYAAGFMPAMLYGETTSQITSVDDWFFSGLSINPNMPFLHMEPNRYISTTAPTDPATNSDNGTVYNQINLTRKDLRDNEAAYGYVLGAPVDVQRLTGNAFTHPDTAQRWGSPWVAEIVADSVKYALGLGGWRGPVSVVSAAFTDTSKTKIDVTFTGPAGFSLTTLAGGAVTGFEVNGSKAGFSAAIIGARKVRLTISSGSWSAGTTVMLKPGGPGNYGAGFDEAGYVAGALVNKQDGMLVRSTTSNVAVV